MVTCQPPEVVSVPSSPDKLGQELRELSMKMTSRVRGCQVTWLEARRLDPGTRGRLSWVRRVLAASLASAHVTPGASH